jgi:hypothetical protein
LQNLREALKSDYIEERCERLVNAFITNLETQKLLHEKSLVLELDKETETFFRLIILDRSYDSVDRINQHLSLLNDVSTEDETIVLWGKIAGYLCCLAENFVTVYNELQYNLEKQIGREGIRNRYGDIAKSIDQLFEKLQ